MSSTQSDDPVRWSALRRDRKLAASRRDHEQLVRRLDDFDFSLQTLFKLVLTKQASPDLCHSQDEFAHVKLDQILAGLAFLLPDVSQNANSCNHYPLKKASDHVAEKNNVCDRISEENNIYDHNGKESNICDHNAEDNNNADDMDYTSKNANEIINDYRVEENNNHNIYDHNAEESNICDHNAKESNICDHNAEENNNAEEMGYTSKNANEIINDNRLEENNNTEESNIYDHNAEDSNICDHNAKESNICDHNAEKNNNAEEMGYTSKNAELETQDAELEKAMKQVSIAFADKIKTARGNGTKLLSIETLEDLATHPDKFSAECDNIADKMRIVLTPLFDNMDPRLGGLRERLLASIPKEATKMLEFWTSPHVVRPQPRHKLKSITSR